LRVSNRQHRSSSAPTPHKERGQLERENERLSRENERLRQELIDRDRKLAEADRQISDGEKQIADLERRTYWRENSAIAAVNERRAVASLVVSPAIPDAGADWHRWTVSIR
jgi:hypothetical protein